MVRKRPRSDVTYTYQTITTPQTTVEVSYTIQASGKIRVAVTYHGSSWITIIASLWLTLCHADPSDALLFIRVVRRLIQIEWLVGCWRIEVTGLPVTPYLVPQDCGVHMATDWVTIYRQAVLDNCLHEPVETGEV